MLYYNQEEDRKEVKKMYEYEIYNERTNEHDFCYGYDVKDMKKRNPRIDWNEWKIIYCEYID